MILQPVGADGALTGLVLARTSIATTAAVDRLGRWFLLLVGAGGGLAGLVPARVSISTTAAADRPGRQ